MAKHCSCVYYTRDSYLAAHEDTPNAQRRAQIRWKRWVERNGDAPMVIKCSICSGDEHRRAIKTGKFKVSTREDGRLRKEELRDTRSE